MVIKLATAAERFARDYESIVADYHSEGDPIAQAYMDGLAGLEAEKKRLDDDYHGKARALRDQYRARIRHAAEIRASKADDETADDIRAACHHGCIMMGGSSNDFPVVSAQDDMVRHKLTSLARKRAERKAERERQERAAMYGLLRIR